MAHIIFLRVETTSHAEARALAVEVVDGIRASHPLLDLASTQIAPEDAQSARDFILCGQMVDGGRCVGLDGHAGICSPDWPDE